MKFAIRKKLILQDLGYEQKTLFTVNLLVTEREGRTGEYWPEVVAVRTERSEVRTKNDRAPARLA